MGSILNFKETVYFFLKHLKKILLASWFDINMAIGIEKVSV